MDVDLSGFSSGTYRLCLKSKPKDQESGGTVIDKTFEYVLTADAIVITVPAAGSVKVGDSFTVSLSALDSEGKVARTFNEKVEFNVQGYGIGSGSLMFKACLASQTVQATKSGLLVFRTGHLGGPMTLKSSSASLSVSDATAANIALSGFKRSWAVACTGPSRVYLVDSFGNPTTVASLRTVSLAASAGGTCSDSSCSTSAASVAVASGSSFGEF